MNEQRGNGDGGTDEGEGRHEKHTRTETFGGLPVRFGLGGLGVWCLGVQSGGSILPSRIPWAMYFRKPNLKFRSLSLLAWALESWMP